MMVLAGKGMEAGLRGENRWKQDGSEKYEWKGIKTDKNLNLESSSSRESLHCLNVIMGMKSSLWTVAHKKAQKPSQACNSDSSALQKCSLHGLGRMWRWQVSYLREPAKCNYSNQVSGCVSVLHTVLIRLPHITLDTEVASCQRIGHSQKQR